MGVITNGQRVSFEGDEVRCSEINYMHSCTAL